MNLNFVANFIHYQQITPIYNMKKNIFRLAFAFMMAIMPVAMNAQLTNILKKAKETVSSSSPTAGTVMDVVGNILGTKKISAKSLQGTWIYTQPCVAFESENALSNLGGSVAQSKIETKLKQGLEKAGIKAGQMSITFKADNTFSATAGQKTVTGTYKVEGADLTLTFNKPAKSVKTNAKISLTTLQIAMKADKMLDVVSTIATKASAYSSQMGTVSQLLSQYKSMYLGLKFEKK